MNYLVKIITILLFTLNTLSLTGQTNIIFHRIPEDKIFHFTAGAIVSITAYKISMHINHNRNRSVLVGIGAGTLIGVAKECYDMTGRGAPSLNDALATSLGSTVICVRIKF